MLNTNKILSEKRKYIRINFSLDVYYPLVNNKSIYETYNGIEPILTALNLSETGICFESRIGVNKWDFISFLMKIKNEPSFWCLCRVQWCKKVDNVLIIGCEFFSLTLNQLNTIKGYVLSEKLKLSRSFNF